MENTIISKASREAMAYVSEHMNLLRKFAGKRELHGTLQYSCEQLQYDFEMGNSIVKNFLEKNNLFYEVWMVTYENE